MSFHPRAFRPSEGPLFQSMPFYTRSDPRAGGVSTASSLHPAGGACYTRLMSHQPPVLSDAAVRDWFARTISPEEFRGKRVLVLVPDATRTAPLTLLFDALASQLLDVARSLDVLIALGTHP